MKPYLTIVVTSRNDNHGLNMMHRFRHFMRVIEQLNRVELPAELIIVEWNPPKGARLHEVMTPPGENQWVTIRFLEVSPQLHSSFPNRHKIPLFQMIAKNVGIRRAKGSYTLSTCNDLIFSEALIRFLARRTLQPEHFYRCDRHDLSVRLIDEDLPLARREAYCRENTSHISGIDDRDGASLPPLLGEAGMSDADLMTHLSQNQPERPHTNAAGDFTLMSTEAWHTMGAHPEIPIGDIYVDGLVIYAALAMGFRQICLPPPMCAFHIFHSLNAGGKDGGKARHASRPSLDHDSEYLSWCMAMMDERRVINPNGIHWGLGNHKLPETIWQPQGVCAV